MTSGYHHNLTLSYAYDALGRLTKKTRAIGANSHDFDFAYDAAGRRTEMTWSDASAKRGLLTAARMRDARSITFTHDDLGRVITKDVPGSGVDPTYDYTYDNFGRIVYDRHGSISRDFVYDALGRLLKKSHTLSSSIHDLEFDYDAAGRRTSMTWPDGFAVDYNYDVLGRPISMVNDTTTLATVSYDDLGRRASLTYGNGTSVDYAFDAAGRLSDLDWDLNGTGDDFNYDMTFTPASQLAALTVSDASLAWSPAGCPCRLLDSAVFMMQSAKVRHLRNSA